MKRKYTLTAAALWLATAAGAQSPILGRIAMPDPATGARVTVDDRSGIVLHGGSDDTRAKGYRVRIFFDNSQNARSQAYGVKTDFAARYPGVPVYLTYETPYFKITVGDCMTREEVTMLWGKLVGDYPKAFIVTEQIPLSHFERAYSVERTDPDTQETDEEP